MAGFISKNSKSGIIRDQGLKGGIASAYGTSIFTGDPIAITGGSIVRATAASANIAGIFKGVDYTTADGARHTSAYWPAGTVATKIDASYEGVDDDKVFEVAADGAMAQTTLGQYVTYVIGTGSSRSGQANVTVTASSANAASTSRDLRVVGILNYVREDGVYNEWGAATTRILVTPLRAGDTFVG
jgi:hypothetical protein